ncbi:hypothetical protein [Paenibacillus sp.]|uniref:hypothetical protein n=1 Tax=Paenibacillus sp. TaxID=58172 RepID=UPI00282F0744|nr:hypothetical protein [Paenibacillus sp.]MDR0270485.1 hypothetical protein [Paenibacillus sp.]
MIENYTSIEQIDIDTLVNMVKMAYEFENWREVISLSASLLDSAETINNNPYKGLHVGLETKRHISYYFGYSYLMKGLAFQKLKMFPYAFECIDYYSDLSWLDDSTDEANTVIEDFRKFAKGNLLTLEILTGNKTKLSEYVEFLEQNHDQILSGLITLLESAIYHGYSIDRELEQLTYYVQDSYHADKVLATRYLSFSFMLSLYDSLNNNLKNAINRSLHNLVFSDKIGNDNYFKKSVILFETLKPHASASQLRDYSTLIKKIFEGEISNEEGFNFSHRFSHHRIQ